MKRLIKTIVLSILLFFGSYSFAAKSLSALPEHPVAKDIPITGIDGKVYHISDYRGKIVIVNYFATWCQPCREEIPSLNKMWHKLKADGIVVLAVNSREKPGVVKKFLKNHPIDFPVLVDEKGILYNEWPMLGLPTTLVIDQKGRFIYRAIGKRDWNDNKLLAPIYMLEYETVK